MIKDIIFFIPNIDDGGIERNLILLSNYFLKKKYKVKILYSRISPKIKHNLNSKIIFKKTNNYLNLNFFNSRINNAINCFLSSLINIKFSKDSVLFSMQDHPFTIILSFFKKVPSVIRIANHPIGSLKFFNNFLLFRIKLWIKIFFYHFSTVIICNSIESSSYFKKTLFFKKKIYCIYNPISKKVLKKNYPRNKFEIVTVGRLEKQKNLIGLIKAISIVSIKNSKIKLTIVGKGSLKEKLTKYVKLNRLNKFIKFKKFSKPDIYYKTKGILILNSFFEGLPNVLLEGMQYKIPIISTKCQSGPNEILKKGKYGYLTEIDNENDVAKKILEVILNYPKANNKAKNAYKSLDRFMADSQCKKYDKIIKNL